MTMAGSLKEMMAADVLRLFGSASTIQMIAEQLGLDRQQVERAKDEAIRKPGLTSRLQAMNYVRCRLNHDCWP